jgi:hypothetical protein
MYGQVWTQTVVKRVLQELCFNTCDPIEIAIMKLVISWLRVYLPPKGWQQVVHEGYGLGSKYMMIHKESHCQSKQLGLPLLSRSNQHQQFQGLSERICG